MGIFLKLQRGWNVGEEILKEKKVRLKEVTGSWAMSSVPNPYNVNSTQLISLTRPI